MIEQQIRNRELVISDKVVEEGPTFVRGRIVQIQRSLRVR